MQKLFSCPVCKTNSWMPIESYRYLRNDLSTGKYTRYSGLLRKMSIVCRAILFARPRRNIVHYSTLSAYHKLRRRVLFEVWFKEKEELILSSIYCKNCGFACYKERPEDEDIADKYNYLKSISPDVGGQSEHDLMTKKLDLQRAIRVYRKCKEYSGKEQLNVLDYGGGNGKIMLPFLEDNHNCYLIDYNDHPLPGVTKLGNDINSCITDIKFDVIICSHVLEHVSNLNMLANWLKDKLNFSGIIYAEVPHEIWAGLRIDADPVTHINYFTRNSFANLFLVNGFMVNEICQQISNYANTQMEVVWVVAKTGAEKAMPLLPNDIDESLFPSRLYSLKKLYKLLFKPALTKIRNSMAC